MEKFKKYYTWIVAFVFAVAVIAVYKTFDNIKDITSYIGTIFDALQPFVLAFIIAYILNLPAKRIQSLIDKSRIKFLEKHSLGISIFVIYILAAVIVVLVLRMLIPAIYRNTIELYNNLPNYIQSFEDYINSFELAKKFNLGSLDLFKQLEIFIGSIDMSQFGKYAEGVFTATSSIFSVFIAIIASIYMLIDKKRLQQVLLRVMGVFFKKKTLDSVMLHAKRINDVFTNYIYCRLTCSVIMAFACSIALMIMNVKYALVLGIFIGAMDMIPYFGSIISCVLAILATFITGGFWQGIWVGIVLIVLQQLDANILAPKIMGNTLEIKPLWIIFSVSVGGTLFGFVGVLISVPVVAIIRMLCTDYIVSREAKLMETEKKQTVKKESADNGE